MRMKREFAMGLLTPLLLIGCSTTIVARRPFEPVAKGVAGHQCTRDEECERGTCEEGHCVGGGWRKPTSLEEINEALEGHSAKVFLVEGAQRPPLEASELKIGADRAQWLESLPTGESRPQSVRTDAVRRIVVVNRVRGAAEGLVLGILAGLATGAITGAVIGSQTRSCGTGDNVSGQQCPIATAFLTIVGAVAGVISGAPIGTIIGVAFGHRTTVELEPGRTAP